MHQVVGGNSFNATMTAVKYDASKESTCTSCTFNEDFSNYWTANCLLRREERNLQARPPDRYLVNLGLKGSGAPCTGDDTAAFPNKTCPGGIPHHRHPPDVSPEQLADAGC